ncbi:MAG: hypothetical protein ACPGXY_04645 [Alphaproteobacteria bacterium]
MKPIYLAIIISLFLGHQLNATHLIQQHFHTASIADTTWPEYKKEILNIVQDKAPANNPAYSKRSTRDTWNYGYSFYQFDDDGNPKFNKIPQWLQDLGEKVSSKFKDKVPDGFVIDNILIADYKTGDQVTPHFDFGKNNYPHENRYPYNKADLNYHYGDIVLGLVVEIDEDAHLYWVYSEDTNGLPDEKALADYSMNEKEADVYMIEGPIRFHPYYHAVTPAKNRRISITFRQTIFQDK